MAKEYTHKPRVLLVDDERLILRCLGRLLRGICEIFTAQDYHQARARIQQQPLDAVVSDCRMPGHGGADVLAAARELQPNAVRIMCSSEPPQNLQQLQRTGIVQHYVDKAHTRGLQILLESLGPPDVLNKAS